MMEGSVEKTLVQCQTAASACRTAASASSSLLLPSREPWPTHSTRAATAMTAATWLAQAQRDVVCTEHIGWKRTEHIGWKRTGICADETVKVGRSMSRQRRQMS